MAMSNALKPEDFRVTFGASWIVDPDDAWDENDPQTRKNAFLIRYDLCTEMTEANVLAALDALSMEHFGEPLNRKVFLLTQDDTNDANDDTLYDVYKDTDEFDDDDHPLWSADAWILRLNPETLIDEHTIIRVVSFLQAAQGRPKYGSTLAFTCAWRWDAKLEITVTDSPEAHTYWDTYEDSKSAWRHTYRDNCWECAAVLNRGVR
jgi:hypothetical protein